MKTKYEKWLDRRLAETVPAIKFLRNSLHFQEIVQAGLMRHVEKISPRKTPDWMWDRITRLVREVDVLHRETMKVCIDRAGAISELGRLWREEYKTKK